jgi:two-component system, LytTR family, sensor kinase
MITNTQPHVKEKWIRILGIPFLGFLLPLFIRSEESKAYISSYIGFALICTVFTFFFWQGNYYITTYLRQKYPGFKNTTPRIVTQLLFSFIYTLAITIILTSIIFYMLSVPFLIEEFIFNFNVGFGITVFVSTIYESVYFFEEWKKTIVEAQELKRANMQSQFETLKNQVNPHFLFNSLNTLITIIPENPILAEEFTHRLSNVYRYVLHHKDKELVPLREEINFVEDYLFLQQIRFGKNLLYKQNIDEQYQSWLVAPLALQMLMENAIKHNIISSSKPLVIEISTNKDQFLVVKNNLQKKENEDSSTKVGLQNIIDRYKFLTQKNVEISITSDAFIVSLPLLKIEENTLVA